MESKELAIEFKRDGGETYHQLSPFSFDSSFSSFFLVGGLRRFLRLGLVLVVILGVIGVVAVLYVVAYVQMRSRYNQQVLGPEYILGALLVPVHHRVAPVVVGSDGD